MRPWRPTATLARSIERGIVSYPQPPAASPKRRRSINDIVIAAVACLAALFIGVAIGFAAGKSTAAPIDLAANPAPTATVTERVSTVVTVGPTPPATTAPTVKPKPTPKPKATIQDGFTVVVGEDVPPGTYEAHSTNSDCYWEIDKHGTSQIIDNDVEKQGHLVITLKVGEDFSSASCGDWVKK